MDLETDPFEFDHLPLPFVAGFFDGENFHHRWGRDCVAQMMELISHYPPGIIYIHNGGRFDIYYMLDYLEERMMIVNSRIVKAHFAQHEIRDSYAIMPFPLAQYKKDEIDYGIFVPGEREKPENKAKIISYLGGDCRYLWTLCSEFSKRFGQTLTIGSTSMRELQQFHSFESLPESTDEDLRSKFYYGGRVQCFESGIIETPLKVYDVNSMYPYAMRDFKHPIGKPTYESRKITRDTCFVIATGLNHGAFPSRTKEGITFEVKEGTFGVSIHEWKAALDLGLFEPFKIERCINFERRDSFAKFVNFFYTARKQAKIENDDIHALFLKYVLNSAYGKFAQNPANYFDYKITPADTLFSDWKPAFVVENKYVIWQKPAKNHVRHNVATAASITGAARSVLMRAIAKAKRPVYCDTDSIVCESLDGVPIHDTELGAWKCEATGDRAAIAGKKLYAIFNGGECIKMASKGVKVTPEEIVRVCNGEIITFKKDAPSFKWDGTYNFIERRVRMTV